MGSERARDRRKATYRPFRLGKPLFALVPETVAAPLLVCCALVAVIAAQTVSAIWFGPIFLLICACGAWFAGNRFAILLSLYIATIQFFTGNAIASHLGPTVMAVQFCTALAVVVMLGVARSALQSEWRFARIDPLTGALNRQAFFEAVEDQQGEACATLLIFADLDELKETNDRFGHQAGDEALRHFASQVRKGIRKDDIFARIGGDEFAIILQVRDEAAAEMVARRLHQLINAPSPGPTVGLKCSLGALVLPDGLTSIDAALKQADALMYAAKRDGSGLMSAMSGSEAVEIPAPTVRAASLPRPKPTMRPGSRATNRGGAPIHAGNPLSA